MPRLLRSLVPGPLAAGCCRGPEAHVSRLIWLSYGAVLLEEVMRREEAVLTPGSAHAKGVTA